MLQALHTAAAGSSNFLPRHRTTHSYTLNDLKTQDFDPDLELNKISDMTSSSSNLHNIAMTSQSLSTGQLFIGTHFMFLVIMIII